MCLNGFLQTFIVSLDGINHQLKLFFCRIQCLCNVLGDPFSASHKISSILRIMPATLLGERKFNSSNKAIIFLEASLCFIANSLKRCI
jgi:hypothetical protein